jgi:hypothetical protein
MCLGNFLKAFKKKLGLSGRTPLTQRFIKMAERPQTLFIEFSPIFSLPKHSHSDFRPSLSKFEGISISFSRLNRGMKIFPKFSQF